MCFFFKRTMLTKKQQKNEEEKQVSPSEKPTLIRRGADKRGKTKKKEEKIGKKRVEGQGCHEKR
jgi:hypothetical protein